MFFHKYSNDNFDLKSFELNMIRDFSLKVRRKISFAISDDLEQNCLYSYFNG